jgi:hypothetical protein
MGLILAQASTSSPQSARYGLDFKGALYVIVLMESRTKLSGQSPEGAQVIVRQVALIYSLGAPSPAPKGIG